MDLIAYLLIDLLDGLLHAIFGWGSRYRDQEDGRENRPVGHEARSWTDHSTLRYYPNARDRFTPGS